MVAAADEEAERLFVAGEILRLGVQPRDVAVLCKTNKSCELFAETLRSRGIPVAASGTGSLMRNAAVVETVSMLRVADSPRTAGREISWLLTRRGIYEHNIAAINRVARRKTVRGSPDDHIFETILEYSGSEQDAEIREVARHFERLIKESETSYLTDTLYRIMMEYTDLYRKNANSDTPEAARNRAVLNSIYRMAEDYQHHYYGERLSDFVEYLTTAADLEYSNLDVSPTAIEDADAGDAYDAVSVLTMHKSKGKEFKTVFVTGLHQGGLPGEWKRREFAMPADLLGGGGREPDSREAYMHESRNLLYVSMTRAEDRLYLTRPRMTGEGAKEREPSEFLGQITEGAPAGTLRQTEYDGGEGGASIPAARDPLDDARYAVQEAACKAVRESRVEAAAAGLVELARLTYIQRHGGDAGGFDPAGVLAGAAAAAAAAAGGAGRGDPLPGRTPLVRRETLSLSASAIRSYLDCPLQFKYRRVLAIPERPSHAMTKGSIVHDVIDTLAKERLGGGAPDVDAGVRHAQEKWEAARRIHDDGPGYEKAGESLEGLIRGYARWDESSPNDIVETEAKFETRIDGIRYTGRIDRVERNARGGYEIVDFKTGSTALTKNKVPLDPQLNIYAEAARAKYGVLPEKVSLLYLERNNTTREYPVTPESLEAGLDVVRAAARDIMDEKFEPAPAYRCRWCSYKSICPAMIKE